MLVPNLKATLKTGYYKESIEATSEQFVLKKPFKISLLSLAKMYL